MFNLKILLQGGSALDAVEAAIRCMEDDPLFDAGLCGSVLNADGQVEMDAIVATGGSHGAVAGLRRFKNPVSVARAVMEKSPHVLLMGEGAERFAESVGMQACERPEEFVTEAARNEWRTFKAYRDAVGVLFHSGCGSNAQISTPTPGSESDPTISHDTVGAVAVDERGVLAAGTSTGGITGKMPGRVGDSPIYGCGCYLEEGLCAISTTGHGESIIKATLARTASALLEMGVAADLSQALQMALRRMHERTGGCGGMIAANPDGQLEAHFTTERMISCAIGPDGVISFPTHTE